VLCRVPKSAQPFVATLVRTIFAQPSAEEVAAQLARVVDQLEDRFPDVATMLEEAAADITAFSTFPTCHWRQIWSNNPQERLNREIRRRSDVVGIFPDRGSIIRLVGSVLSEQHDEWQVSRRYMSIESIEKTMEPLPTVEDGLDREVIPALMAS
jgi:transposase-like protein